MKIIALLLMALFYGCYFGKMFAQRRQGIETNQMGKGKQGFVLLVEVTLKCTTILIVAVELCSIFLGTTALPQWCRILGAVLAACGVAFFYASVLTMKDSWRAGVPQEDETALVTRGVFQISRNPAFLGFDLTYLGIGMMFFNPWHALMVLVCMVMMHLQIVNAEEPFLRERFGDAYLAYQKKVCRYLGRK